MEPIRLQDLAEMSRPIRFGVLYGMSGARLYEVMMADPDFRLRVAMERWHEKLNKLDPPPVDGIIAAYLDAVAGAILPQITVGMEQFAESVEKASSAMANLGKQMRQDKKLKPWLTKLQANNRPVRTVTGRMRSGRTR